MTLCNRVQPDGTFAAVPARGTLMGNRGILHEGDKIGPARWKHKAWVCCELSFRGRHRRLLQPGRWTELFFLDEAVALAAGHRPCGECRRRDYDLFAEAWQRAFGEWPGPKSADTLLHEARAERGARRLKHKSMAAAALPDGAMFRWEGAIYLKWRDAAHPYTPFGYGAVTPLPAGEVDALTNAVTRKILEAGYRPRLHESIAL